MHIIFKIFIGLFVILIFLTTTITHKYGPYMGRVLDVETDLPIEGAAVHLSFYIDVLGLHGSSKYVGAVESLTNQNGEFSLSRRITKIKLLSLWDPHPHITVFKPEYGAYPRHEGVSINPKPVSKWSMIDEKISSIIRLPKLNTDKERRQTLSDVSPLGPVEDQKLIRTLENQERIYLGLKPYKSIK